MRAIEIFWKSCCALRADIALFIVAALAGAASQALAQGSEPRLLVPPPGVGSTPPSTAPSTPALSPGPSGVNAPLIPAANPAAARLEVRMTQLEQDLRSVTGRLEEVSFQIRKLEDRLNKLTSDMEYRLSEMKSGGGSEASPEPPPGGGAGAGAAVAGGGAVASTPRAPAQIQPSGASAPTQTANLPPRTAREQYARAFSLLEKRNYEEAGTGFSEFLKANPNDPLADNARYWLGETYYARGDYARSAEIFLDGYEKNKTGPKAPDTLLKLGLSLSGLDKKKEACASFRELSRAFPNAPDSVEDKAAQESKRLGCT